MKKSILEGTLLTDKFFLPDLDLFYIIVIKKGSFGYGTFYMGLKWHQQTVTYHLQSYKEHILK